MAKLKKRSKLAQRRLKAKQLQKDGKAVSGKKGNASSVEQKGLQKVAPLLSKLESGSPNDKVMAINAITMLCDNSPELRRLFLKQDLVKTVMTRLLHDDNNDVVVDSYGLLRNLMVDEGYSLCTHLWRSDLWTLLEKSFSQAKDSLPHLMDAKANNVQQMLLVNFLDNLLGVADSLSTEVSPETFEAQVLPKLESSGVLKLVFDLISQEGSKKLSVSGLEFVYDLAAASYKFIETIAQNNEFAAALDNSSKSSKLGKLGNAYLIGTLLQVMEYRDEIKDQSKLKSQVLDPLMKICKEEIDLPGTVKTLDLPFKENPSKDEQEQLDTAKESFHAVEVVLDLLTSVVEMVGESLEKGRSSRKLAEVLEEQVRLLLGELLEQGFKSNKILDCLNNLIVLSEQIGADNEVVSFLETVQSKLGPQLEALLSKEEEADGCDEQTVEEINDLLQFSESYAQLEDDPAKWQASPELVQKLIKESEKVSEAVDSGELESAVLGEFNRWSVPYLGKIAKKCGDDTTTAEIAKFLVDEKLLKYLQSYGKFKSAQEAHKKVGHLVEETLNSVINTLFDVFDDDYSYNRPIFHEGGLLTLLQEQLPELKKVYKAIDKNVDGGLKAQTEETLHNLERFIAYKERE